MKTLITNFSATLLLVLISIISNAAIIYVDIDATGADDGSSWNDAYLDLQDAIGASNSGDEIWVAQGIYKPTDNTTQTIYFSIPGGVEMYGGFAGGETSKTHRNWNQNETILSGQIGNQLDDSDNSNAVIQFFNQTGDIVFDGFIVEDANSSSLYNFNFQSTDLVELANCIFRDNFQTGSYQFYFNNSEAVFENCLFHNNEAPNLISTFVSSAATFHNCTFANNDVTRVFTGNTVGIHSMYNCISWGNDFSLAPTSIEIAHDCILQDGTSGITTFSNILNINPLFSNPSINNYSLLAASPARDLGDNANIISSYDLDKANRLSNGDVDAGSYEYQNPTIIYVDENASGADNGSTWANAYNELPDAFSGAQSGDQIWVANGTYNPTTTSDRNAGFSFPDGVAIYGGFAGGETNLNNRNWNVNASILSGEIGTSSNTDNTLELLKFSNNDYPVILDGFKIEDGYGDGVGDVLMYFSSSENVNISNCDFRNNIQTATSLSYIISTSVQFDNCLFRDNIAAGNLFWVVVGSDVCVNNCTLSQNDMDNAMFISNSAGLLSVMNTISYANIQGGPNNGIDYASNCIVETGTTGMSVSSNIISDDPQFINPAGNNFYLEFTSPAINHGVNASISEYDLGHQTRIKGGIVDAGCYEKQINDIVYVDVNASGNDDGTSWANAYESFSNALNEMGSGFDYWVAGGTYKASTTNVNIAINLPDDVNLIGGFDGTETNVTQRDLGDTPTILSGDIGTLGLNTDNSVSIFVINNATAGISIDGFTLEDTYRSTSDFSDDRGAIRADDSDLEIYNCIFRNNTAYAEPAVNLDNTDLFMENCLIHDNVAIAGSLVSCTSGASDMEIVNCTFSENTISGTNNIIGALTSSNVDLFNCIIWENSINDLVSPTSTSQAHNCILSTGTEDLDSFSNIRLEDPLFVDAANEDFQITASSNAYDAGNAFYSSLDKDLNGDDRIIDTAIDRGCFESSVCEQPNDLCANAVELVLDATATFGSNRCATDTAGEESACFVNDGHSVWYSFEAPASGSVEVISTWVAKFTSTFNIRHVVFEGSCGSFTQLACDNDSPGGNGETTPVSGLVAGDTYYIRFDAYNTQEGRFTIRVETAEIPPVAGVTYVDLDATGANDGSSWANAYTSVDEALTNTADGDIIWVAEGIYYPIGSSSMTITHQINLIGGFDGSESNADSRNLANNPTIISGDIGVLGDPTDNSHTLFELYNLNAANTVIDGLIFEDTYVDPAEGYNLQAAVKVARSTTILNCVFRNCESPHTTGVLFEGDFGGDTTNNDYRLENCLFYNNQTGWNVVRAYYALNTEIVNCTFANNSGSDASISLISGSTSASAMVNISNSIIYENTEYTGVNNIDNMNNSIDQDGGAGATISNMVVAYDPEFTNSGANDYTLSNTSAAIGYGLNIYSSTSLDLGLNARIQQTTIDAGAYESSYTTVYGCLDIAACNYNASAITDDGSCQYPDGCTDGTACNYDAGATCDDGSCILPDGCTDSAASNYDFTALCDDGTCVYCPSTIYVDIDATGSNDGTSWANAFNSLYDGLALSCSGSEVWVAEGTYYTDGNSPFDRYVVPSGVFLFGGFNGTESSNSDADWKNNETIISGDYGVLGDPSDNSPTLLVTSSMSENTVINGFIFQDVTSTDFWSAVTLIESGVGTGFGVVSNCIFRDNIFENGYAILFSGSNGSLVMKAESCLFYDNESSSSIISDGGAIISFELVNCTFSENTIIASFGVVVGHFSGSTDVIRNCVFWNNNGAEAFGSGFDLDYTLYDIGSSTALNNLTVDPQFVDPANRDFTLSTSSPAIDMGQNGNTLVFYDLAKELRTQDGTIDMGAYEGGYVSGTCFGDANNDGVIDILDLVAVSSNFGCNTGCTFGDANGDGVVDILDLIAVSSNFGIICP